MHWKHGIEISLETFQYCCVSIPSLKNLRPADSVFHDPRVEVLVPLVHAVVA